MFDPNDPTEYEDYFDYAEGCNAFEGFVLYTVRQCALLYPKGVPGAKLRDELFAVNAEDASRVARALWRLEDLGYLERLLDGSWQPLSLLETLARSAV